ncbi:glycoside hydrolase family 26 protein [Gaetbulibacter jejuensis]|uniref:glycoside hydrolase family 26 protein n=1 Tax=Gaetbulibacter jejuensis TaxID=584607 RepID=UPI0031D60BB4
MILFFLFLPLSCKNDKKENLKKDTSVEKDDIKTKRSIDTEDLISKLYTISKKGFAIGHQDATSYGLNWKHEDSPEVIKSDVKEVSGKLPAVYGFDIGHIELNNTHNLDSVSFTTMRQLMIDAYKKGGIITVSWHADNPTSNGDSWDKTSTVSDIIKGGKHHDKYQLWVKRVADFLKSVEINNQPIPIVFRPFHEMNGSWFWWGEGNCSVEDYKTLWIETVDLLRDTHQLNNLLYAYSPNKLNPTDDYMKYYPGDEYVDIFGIDIYDFKDSEGFINSLQHDLAIVKEIADQKQKPYAFTETGLETLSTPNWFTEVLYPNLENTGISWVLFWRNARPDHHYMPYKGHPIVDDFKAFEALPKTLFLEDLTN